MKKLKFVIALVLLSSLNVSASLRDSFYVGVGLGDEIDNYKLQVVAPLVTINKSPTLDHLVAAAFAGWGHTTCSNFYLAGEIGTYFPRREITLERPGASIVGFSFVNTINVRDWVTGDFLVGFRPNCCFLYYLRGGVSYAHLGFTQFENPSAGTITLNARTNRAAGRVGVGVNYAFTECFGIGLDYIFSCYPHLRTFAPNGTEFIAKVHGHYIGLSAITNF